MALVQKNDLPRQFLKRCVLRLRLQMCKDFPTTEEGICNIEEETWSLFSGAWGNLFVFFFNPQKKLLCVFFFTDEIWRCFWCYSAGKTSWAHRVCLSSQIIACKWINGKCGAKMWEMLVVYVKKEKEKVKVKGVLAELMSKVNSICIKFGFSLYIYMASQFIRNIKI